MAKGSTTASGSQDEFPEDQVVAARLVATFPSARADWDETTLFRYSNFRTFSVFFCPEMQLLHRRGKTIETASKKHLGDIRVARRYLNDLSAGEPVTLDRVLEVNRVLDAIAKSQDSKLRARELTHVQRPSGKVALQLQENSVIPSHLWVDRNLLHAFRRHVGLSPAQLGQLIFGEAEYAENIIDQLEGGIRQKGKLYDYRVSPFTAKRIYAALRAILAARSRLQTGQFATFPTESKFFVASHTAGEGSGRRTLALGITNGNQMHVMTKGEEKAMLDRIAQD